MRPKDTKIAILGDGGWGTTLALLLAEKGYSVALWGAFADYVREVDRKRENIKFLPGFRIPEAVRLVPEVAAACEGAELVVIAVPSQYVRSVARRLAESGRGPGPLVCVAKGIEVQSLRTMSEVIREELGKVKLAVLSGPTIARDVALKMTSAASVASRDRRHASRVRAIFSTEHFALFESNDVIGVELGGSLKNVIAIAAGIVQGLGYGSNTVAFLFARGVAEMARLGHAMGAKHRTFMGLSGLGDLVTTCLSPHSRNRSLGEEIGKGRKLREILRSSEMVVEGVETARSAVKLARRHRIAMPICEAVYGILFHRHNPRVAVEALLERESHWELD